MCGCAAHNAAADRAIETASGDAMVVKVEDMTCGHCSGTVVSSIQAAMPGAAAEANLDTKLVSVRGAPSLAAIEAAILDAGYTPSRV